MGLLFRFVQYLHDLIIKWASGIIAGEFLCFINEKIVQLDILLIYDEEQIYVSFESFMANDIFSPFLDVTVTYANSLGLTT